MAGFVASPRQLTWLGMSFMTRTCPGTSASYRASSGRRLFSCTASPQADYTHAVIGAGAVGLATARKLASRDGASVLLIERNEAVGMETSARNSEVIHAGLYYGETSFKTKLCIKGKNMMYELCKKYDIPHKRVGKWIVAQNDRQREALDKIHDFSKQVNVPTSFISPEEAAEKEPSVQALAGVLVSPTTGIIDSHSYMQYLLGSFEDRGGDVVLNTSVSSVKPLGSNGSDGWEITTVDKATSEPISITVDTIVNSAGHGACAISNMILPPDRHETPHYAKGNYFSYGASSPKTTHLIYPAPEPGHGGLGTHLTLDMAGRIRFGPDVEWVDSPDDLAVNSSRLPQAIEEIRKYLPNVDPEAIVPDYAGIRPKLGRFGVGSGKNFKDFIIRKEEGFTGFVNLLNIESPGLTSSLAIADEVFELLYGKS